MDRTLLDTGQTGIAISVVDLLMGLVLAFFMGLVIVFVYRRTHRGLHYERSFLMTLVSIPSIVAVVMMMIGSNLALSLGMVGALSIIRFRTVIKDSRDMVFLFFCISVGLGCGTYNWHVTIISTVFISLALLVLNGLQFGVAMHADYALVVAGQQSRPGDGLKETVKKYVDFIEVRSVDISDDGWEIVFEIRFFKDRALAESELYDELKDQHQASRISLLAPQLSLPL